MAEDPKKPGSTRALVALLAFVLGFATIPHRVCERDARGWFDGEPASADALGRSVERWVASPPASFATGSSRFDSEWRFATFVMGAMGFGQVALERARDANLASMERCLDAMLAPDVRGFDTDAWHADALDGEGGHVGFLGYAALPLALHEMLRPGSRFGPRAEAILGALVRRIDASPTGLLETYPGETYPVDNAAAIAAIALHHRARNDPPPAALERALEGMRRAIDPRSGLLVQAVTVEGALRDAPRAAGTGLASYFLSFAEGPLSRSLFTALARQFRTVLGFGGILEVPRGSPSRADIDSGPVFLGFGVSASGFALGASRIHGDFDTFRALSATAHLFGAPLDEHGMRTYAFGGPLGDAILFAMLTAPRHR
jgi:hypothetical protein